MNQPSMMPCEEAIRLLMRHLDGDLAEAERADVQHHLDSCRGCGSRAEFERRLRDQLAGLHVAPVAPDFEGRIRHLVARFPLAE